MSNEILKLQCQACDTVFEVARLPMEVTELVNVVKNAKCPECGIDSKELLIDTRKGIEADYKIAES